jgi:hypothetical protein
MEYGMNAEPKEKEEYLRKLLFYNSPFLCQDRDSEAFPSTANKGNNNNAK